jgi:alpha-1,2-mannosyltransferase
LWAAIRATQRRWPHAVCIIYTGDHDVDKAAILRRVKDRFNIHLHAPTVHFLYLTTRNWVLASTWPRFTLLGQSLGSVVLAYDAFSLLVPDIFIDTMGYAFSLALSSWLFPSVPTGAYVHYPTISTDMLDSLHAGGQGVNAGTGAGYRGIAKKKYWQLFAKLYSKVGSTIDVVMTNSTWTQSHIQSLWGSYRQKRSALVNKDINVVFPPVAVEDVTEAVQVSEASEKKRGPNLLYIAQFRPEKNHQIILEAFAFLVHSKPRLVAYPDAIPKLVLIGSVRGSHDDAKRVYKLRLLAHELKIDDNVDFVCDAPWPLMLEWMGVASVGVNGMWNEHFGIGVVEYQAAGLISVVNDSGGPKLDIVVEVDGRPTGDYPRFWFINAMLITTRISRHNGRGVRRGVLQSSFAVAAGNTGNATQSPKICGALHRRCICGEVAYQHGEVGCSADPADERKSLIDCVSICVSKTSKYIKLYHY